MIYNHEKSEEEEWRHVLATITPKESFWRLCTLIIVSHLHKHLRCLSFVKAHMMYTNCNTYLCIHWAIMKSNYNFLCQHLKDNDGRRCCVKHVFCLWGKALWILCKDWNYHEIKKYLHEKYEMKDRIALKQWFEIIIEKFKPFDELHRDWAWHILNQFQKWN